MGALVLLEEHLIILKRRPVVRLRDHRAEVRLRGGQDLFMREIVRDADAFIRMLDHPHRRRDDTDRDLDRRGVLMRDKLARLVDREDAPGPPGIIFVPHDE